MHTGSLPAARALAAIFFPSLAFALLTASAFALLARLHAAPVCYGGGVAAFAALALTAALLRPLPRPQYAAVPAAAGGVSLRLAGWSPAPQAEGAPRLLLRLAEGLAAALTNPDHRLFVAASMGVQIVSMAPLACLLSAGLWPTVAGLWLLRHPVHGLDHAAGGMAFLTSALCLAAGIFFTGGLRSLLPVRPLEAAYRVGVLPERPARFRRARGFHAAFWTLGALACSVAVCAASWRMLKMLPGSTLARPFAALLAAVMMPWLWLAYAGRAARRPLPPLIICAALQCALAIYLAATGRLGPLVFWPY